MKDGTIQDSQITSSGAWHANHDTHGPRNARLDHLPEGKRRGAWQARNNNANPWIQVDLGVATSVSAIVIQGRANGRQWVTEYNVQYGNETTGQQYLKDKDSNETVTQL